MYKRTTFFVFFGFLGVFLFLFFLFFVSFSTINTTLPASDPLSFRKNSFYCFILLKMTVTEVTDQIKILDKKIKQTEKQLKYLHCFVKTWINMNI